MFVVSVFDVFCFCFWFVFDALFLFVIGGTCVCSIADDPPLTMCCVRCVTWSVSVRPQLMKSRALKQVSKQLAPIEKEMASLGCVV